MLMNTWLNHPLNGTDNYLGIINDHIGLLNSTIIKLDNGPLDEE